MKAFITGASGFVGSHVASVLAQKGYRLRALVRPTSRVSHLLDLDCQLVYGDLRNKKDVVAAMKGCDVGFHIAADYRLWVEKPESMYMTNVLGTKNVLEAAKDLCLKRLVYTSTVGALGLPTCGGVANEETPVSFGDMIGHYKKSKYLAEKLAEKHAHNDLPVVIVNPSTPVGPGDHKPTPTGKIVVDFLNRKIPGYINTGLNLVDVRDVAVGHLLALERGRPGEKYILGNKNMTLMEIFRYLEELSGCPAPRWCFPYYPVLCAAYLNEALSKMTKKQPMIPIDGVRMGKKYMFFDARKARKELGLPQTPIKKALNDAIQWFKTNGYVPQRIS